MAEPHLSMPNGGIIGPMTTLSAGARVRNSL